MDILCVWPPPNHSQRYQADVCALSSRAKKQIYTSPLEERLCYRLLVNPAACVHASGAAGYALRRQVSAEAAAELCLLGKVFLGTAKVPVVASFLFDFMLGQDSLVSVASATDPLLHLRAFFPLV